MYLASKYEDIYPLHSKVVSEKIAHKAISTDDIQNKEKAFLADFEYDIDFVSHWDFWQTYSDKFRFHFSKKPQFAKHLKLLIEMALLLVKVCIQNIDFSQYSQSIITMACFYAATSLLKHAKNQDGADALPFCQEARKLIAQLIREDRLSISS